ncbi:MAG: sodium/solute symporter [Elusimicrobia bacterium]|nr:sodium/solute symporter [Elusimicrobiota bacterium]
MEPTAWFGGGTNLTMADGGLLAGLLALMFFIGWYFGREESGTEDFFLGRGSIPVWVACLSFVATEISAMTLIGVPATAFRENWNYAQFFIGSSAAKVAVAFLFIPAFYRYRCTTIYEFLRHRFGPASQYAATCFFFVTRLLASGVRLMAACLAISVLLDWHIVPVIALFTVVGMLYIGYGGIKAVVWTNVLQAVVFILAGAATVAFIVSRVEGGLPAVWSSASAAGRLDLFNLGPGLSDPAFLKKFFSDPNVILVAVLNGFFTSMSAFGTDHEMVQKLLTVETRRQSQLTILSSILGSFVVLLIFLSVGACLFAFYQASPASPLPAQLDKIYPHFASTVMPAFLRGLVLSAIVMASIDSPLASLTAVFVTDIYRPLIKRDGTQAHYMLVSRLSVAVFAVLLGAIAWYLSSFDKMLWLAFKIGGVTYGSLLGVFLFGMTSTRRANKSNVVAMLAMAAVNAVLLLLSEQKVIGLGWSWLVVIGTFGTWGLAWLLAPVLDGPGEAPAVLNSQA